MERTYTDSIDDYQCSARGMRNKLTTNSEPEGVELILKLHGFDSQLVSKLSLSTSEMFTYSNSVLFQKNI